MILDIDKVQAIYDARNTPHSGVTAIAYYNMQKENWYDTLTEKVNDKLSRLLGSLYLSYGAHRHITIMGLNDLNHKNSKEVSDTLNLFPDISIKSFKIMLLFNGLVVAEFYPAPTDKERLKSYRISFEKNGISYKYPANAHIFHSVLGQIVPDELKKLSKDKQILIENSMNKIFHSYNSNGLEEISVVTREDIKVVKFATTSLRDINDSSILSWDNWSKENFDRLLGLEK